MAVGGQSTSAHQLPIIERESVTTDFPTEESRLWIASGEIEITIASIIQAGGLCLAYGGAMRIVESFVGVTRILTALLRETVQTFNVQRSSTSPSELRAGKFSSGQLLKPTPRVPRRSDPRLGGH